MRFLKRVVCVFAAIIMFIAADGVTEASAASVPDPSTYGPYAVGYTTMKWTNANFPGTGVSIYRGGVNPGYSNNATQPREQFIDILYPIDPADAAGLTLTPFYMNYDMSLFPSAGLPRTYSGGSVSKDKAFSLWVPGNALVGTSSVQYLEAYHMASHGIISAAPRATPEDFQPYTASRIDVLNYSRGYGLRILDARAIIDTMLLQSDTPGTLFYNTINPSAIISGGVSFGAATGLLQTTGIVNMAGTAGAPYPDGADIDYAPDTRISAYLGMDPYFAFVRYDTLVKNNIPTMIFASNQNLGTWGSIRAFAAAKSQDKYLITVKGSAHRELFVGRCRLFPIAPIVESTLADCLPPFINPTTVENIIRKYSVAFVKFHVEKNYGYYDYLYPAHEGRQDDGVTDFRSGRSIPTVNWNGTQATLTLSSTPSASPACSATRPRFSTTSNCDILDGEFKFTPPFWAA